MTPGTLPVGEKLKIYRGTADSIQLTMTERSTGNPIDLSGKTFVAQVKLTSRGETLVDMVVDPTDLPNGIITLYWSKELTKNIPISKMARWGVIDNEDTLWIEDICELHDRTPDNIDVPV